MFCTKCGKKLDPDAKFCEGCGMSTSSETVNAQSADEITKEVKQAEFITEEISVIPETGLGPEDSSIHESAAEIYAEDAGNTETVEVISEEAHDEETEKPVTVTEDIPHPPDIAEPSVLISEIHTYEQSAYGVYTDEKYESNEQILPVPDVSGNTDEPAQNVIPSDEFISGLSKNLNVDVIATDENKVGLGRAIGAGFVAVFLIIFLLLNNLILSIRIGTNEKNVKDAVNRANISVLLESKFLDGQSLTDFIYDQLDDDFKDDFDVSKSNVEAFVKESDAKDYIADKINGYLYLVITGNGEPSLTGEDIANFVDDNFEVLQSEMNYSKPVLDDEAYFRIVDSFDETELSRKLVVEDWKEELGFDFSNAYIGIYISIGLLAVFTVAFMVWIFVILKKKMSSVLRNFSAVFILAGILTLVFSAAVILSVLAGNFAVIMAGTLLKPSLAILISFGCNQLFAGMIFTWVRRKTKHKVIKN